MTDGGLDAYMPADRRRAVADGAELRLDATGAVLFADVSGFTPMTEQLVEQHGPRQGAERLTEVLDRVLGALIDDVEHVGGAVVYFSGDAITVWLDGDDGSVAVACGDAMQATMARVGQLTIGARTLALGLKVAIASGTVRRFVVGDPSIQLVDVLAGPPLDAVADAEGAAEPGEVVVTEDVAAAIGTRGRHGERRGGAVVLPPAPPEADRGAVPTIVRVDDDVAAPWVLPTVRERLQSGDGAMVAELRQVLPVFIQFGGVDFTADDGPALVDAFVTGAQRVLAEHGGALLQLTVGDKGAYLYGVFGAPVAHENDPLRAVAAGLELVALGDRTGVTSVRVGISRGGVLSGVHGHPRRRTFVCLGDAVNLAARTMGKAGDGEVVVTPEVRRAVGDAAAWEDREPVALKGRVQPVPLSRALALSAPSGAGTDRTPLLGRDEQLAALRTVAAAPGWGVAAVVGGAGMGSSRLVGELVAELEGQDRPVLRGTARVLGQAAPYRAWHEVWRGVLGLTELDDAAAQVASAVAAVDPALLPRAPLLGTLVGAELADTPLTAAMDARLRKASTEDLAVRLLSAWAERRPVIVLDDAHRLDDVSRDLVAALWRGRRHLDGTLLLAGRPPEPGASDVADLAADVVRLEPLGDDDATRLVDHHVGLRYDEGTSMHPAVLAMVRERAAGNPLAIAELVRALAERGVDPSDPAAAQADLPASLEALVLARVDRLGEVQRRTLKVASVLQRPFLPDALVEVHPQLGDEEAVRRALDAMTGELVVRDEDRYDVRHALTREVAYGSVPFAVRREMHEAVARRVERRHADALSTRYDLLAHHWWHAGTPEPRERYQRLAGAAAKASYANESALLYLERLAAVTEGLDRLEALLDRAEVLLLVGRLDEARVHQWEAAELAEAAGDEGARARVRAALAESLRRAGRFDEALAELRAAGETFAAVGDDAGRARALHLTGTINAQRGDLDAARTAYEAGLAVRDRLGDDAGRADLLSNLGIVAEYSGDLDTAVVLHTRALAVREELGDRWAIVNSLTNLGVIEQLQGRPTDALPRFREALRGNQEVGDPWSVALAHHNLGNALRDLGEHVEAMQEYAAAVEHFAAGEDEWALALLYEDVAALAAIDGQPGTALELLGAADVAREHLEAERGPHLAAAVARTRAVATSALPDAAATHEHRGRERSMSATVERLLALADPVAMLTD